MSIPRVLLFTDKQNTPPMYKAIAIDYISTASFGIVKKNEKSLMKRFGVSKFPTVVVITNDAGGDETIHMYDGEQKKEALYEYLSAFATPVEGRLKGVIPENSPHKYAGPDAHDEL